MTETAPRIPRALPPLLTLGGISAAFGLASSCALPFYLAALGISTAWLGDIGLFASFHRHVFMAVTLVGLIGGAALLVLQHRTMPRPLFWATVAGLGLGALFLFLGTRAA